MAFNKEAFLEEAKELVKKEGKADLKEFLEENAKTVWEVVKLYTKHTDNPVDDMVVATLDKMVSELVDNINKEDNA